MLSIPTPAKDSWAKFNGKTSDVGIFVDLNLLVYTMGRNTPPKTNMETKNDGFL